MIVLFTAVSAVVPSMFLVWFFKTRDVHPEPSGVLWATFWLGVLSIVPTLLVALPVQFALQAAVTDPGLNATLQAAAGAGLILLGCLLALVVGDVPANEVPTLLAGGAVIGVLPLLLGGFLFLLGIRKQPKKRRRRSAYT